MDQVWAKLNEHDARFDRVEAKIDRIEGKIDRLDSDVGGLKTWIVGTAGATIFFVVTCTIGLLGLVYAARQDTTATVGAALSAIQTVLSAKPSDTPQQPVVIMVPPYGAPALPAPAPKPQE